MCIHLSVKYISSGLQLDVKLGKVGYRGELNAHAVALLVVELLYREEHKIIDCSKRPNSDICGKLPHGSTKVYYRTRAKETWTINCTIVGKYCIHRT